MRRRRSRSGSFIARQDPSPPPFARRERARPHCLWPCSVGGPGWRLGSAAPVAWLLTAEVLPSRELGVSGSYALMHLADHMLARSRRRRGAARGRVKVEVLARSRRGRGARAPQLRRRYRVFPHSRSRRRRIQIQSALARVWPHSRLARRRVRGNSRTHREHPSTRGQAALGCAEPHPTTTTPPRTSRMSLTAARVRTRSYRHATPAPSSLS